MESIEDITFLTKPNIDPNKFDYIGNHKNVYANLFEIILHKDIKLLQYPFAVLPEIISGDIIIRQKLFRGCSKDLREKYGECFISGDSLYGTKKYENAYSTKYKCGKNEYTLKFQKFTNEKTIKQEDIHKDSLSKQFIEMLIRDILHANPKLEFYKNLFVLTNGQKGIETNNVSVTFYPGFTTSFIETDGGNYLNVTLKNKIIQNQTVLDFINNYDYSNKNEQQKIKEELKGRIFKVSYMKKNHKIDDIIFDRSPKTQTFNYQEKQTNLIDYYKDAHEIDIEDEEQPLILVRKKGPQDEEINLYFVPELCSLSGLEDKDVKDGFFMRDLAKQTKLEPKDRVFKINQFLELFEDPERKKIKNKKNKKEPPKELMSSKEKSELYGIKIKPLNKLFKAYYMKDTILTAGNNKKISSKDRTFPILGKIDLSYWVCFYEGYNYNNAESLYNTLKAASKSFGIYIKEPTWVEMKNKSKPKEWIDKAEEYFEKGTDDYSFALFLIGDNDFLYSQIKKHSLCTNGYISQVVKSKTIKKKGLMSICSKILLQINAKLGGISYKAEIDKKIKDRDIMVIGIDSSHIKGKGTGVSKVATINDTFTNFYNDEEIINEKNNKEQLQYSVSTFIKQAIVVYNKKNKKLPKNIIIYRQGASLQQKNYLKAEIKEIEQECKNNNILFYYILVNTKTNFKFFEKSGNNYVNPESGLLIIDGVTNKNFFEFYIQPQEVTQGSATPTCFHVAYGNMEFPEMIPKFTYDLCHIYSNWQGTIRIPNVIKAAEKLSKMTAKYTHSELNKNLQIGQSYL